MTMPVSQKQKPKAIRIYEKAFISFRILDQMSGQQQNQELHNSVKATKQAETHSQTEIQLWYCLRWRSMYEEE